MRVVLGNGDRILAFALVIPSASEGRHPSPFINKLDRVTRRGVGSLVVFATRDDVL
jgi:hypothetical protein